MAKSCCRVKPAAPEILAALPMAVLLVDQDLKVHDANGATETMLNMSIGAMTSRRLDQIVVPPAAFEARHGLAFAAFDVDLDTRRAGRLRADFHANPVSDRPGWMVISINGAPSQGLEPRGSNRTAIAIAATLAHEIKNPLSGIRGAAQLLDGRVTGGDTIMTRLIRTEVDRITALIDSMEGFTDSRPLPLAAENIHAIIDHSRRVAEQGFGATLTITDEFDPSLPPVRANHDALIQVIINLLKNAAETANPGEDRHVLLTTRYRQGVSVASGTAGRRSPLPIEFCVIDDGPGAPAELVEQLFDPFVSGKRGGHGLGLALSDKLIRDMGGIIQYQREGKPARTVFRLLLQRAEGV
ncbi:MAG: hypothetical protein RL367_2764 [Pseudomonadota bacterium]|jgi:two-component system nitrogen regulation sensor histidine kinase GlnL